MKLPPFEQVVVDHGPTVLRVCRALLAPHEAEDAAAETFLAGAGARYPRIAPDSNVRAWLVTIAHHKAVDAYRARARRAVPVGEVDDVASGAAPQPPDADLWAAVGLLPAKQRAAVTYRYVADLSYREIAALNRTSEAASRRSAADGVEALRRAVATAHRHEHEEERR